MAAATKDRDAPRRDGTFFSDPVAAGEVIYAGTMVALDADKNAVAASNVVSIGVRGVAQAFVDNASGADGDKTIESRTGFFRLINSGDITRADIFNDAYVVDDQTVSAAATDATAGWIADVDSDGVWVAIGVDRPSILTGG